MIERIDKYLNSLYKNDKTKEIIELKEDMREHLIESVSELKNEGYSEDEAINIAIGRFDGGSDMEKDLDTLIYNKSKKFLNISRNLFIISFAVTLLTFLLYKLEENKVFNLFDEVEKVVTSIAETKDIAKPETYKDNLDKTIRSDKFKDVTYLYIDNGVTDNTFTEKDGMEYFDSTGLKQQYKYNSNKTSDAYGDNRITKNISGEKLLISTAVIYKGNHIFSFFSVFIIISIFSLTVYAYNIISFNYRRKIQKTI